jgi:hypothetical protein
LAAIRVVLSIVILVLLAVAVRPRRAAAPAPAGLAELGLVLITMLVLSGYSWKAHYVALLPGYAAALTYLAEGRQPRRRLIAWFVGISFVLGTLTCDLIGPRQADWAEAIGLIMFGGMALGAALIERDNVRTPGCQGTGLLFEGSASRIRA